MPRYPKIKRRVMPRNIENDAIREKIRRERMLESGLRLFSEHGIESVSLQDIADEAEVGIATLYNYYQNKPNLVIAISAYMWKKVWDANVDRVGKDAIDSRNAYERIEGYLDLMIYLYREHPEILRFSGYYKTYMNLENAERIKNNEHLDVLAPISVIFHNLYEKAKVDKSIRTDIDEQKMFTTIALTMLGMAERYAMGVVWAANDENDYTKELLILKDMLLGWIK